jgi:hypothetical protein
LESSSYDPGTVVTDHFEVVAKSENSIIVRCGDSPRVSEVRESDGLFEMVAEIKKEEQVAEFQLKSVFYNGVAQAEEGKPPLAEPMGPFIQWLHMEYAQSIPSRSDMTATNIISHDIGTTRYSWRQRSVESSGDL